MPLMFITYGLQYLDKITLGYAAVLGLKEDTASDPCATGEHRLTMDTASSRPTVLLGKLDILLWISHRFLARFLWVCQASTRQVPRWDHDLLVYRIGLSRGSKQFR